METQESVEVWKNTAAGMRWIQAINRQGFKEGQTIRGGRTFTVTPFNRQINQDSVASPEQDAFRNGTFVLVKAAKDTNQNEIESPDSLTDSEVLALVYEVIGNSLSVEEALKGINSPIALTRIHEQFILQDDVPKKTLDYVKSRRTAAEGTEVVAERVQVSPTPKAEVVKTPRGGIPEAHTTKIVETTPEKSSG
jgi:hypothetical protein